MKYTRFVVTFFLFLTSAFQFACAENTGSELRLLIRELILASSTQNKEEARQKLDNSILNHPLAIQAWLDGKSTKELLKEANLPPAEKFSSILETIQTGIYPVGSQLNQLHNRLSIEQRKKILSLVPASVKDHALERINSEISDLKLEKFEAVQAINAPNGFSSLGDVPPAAIKLFTDLINVYFEKLSPQSKRQIIIDFLSLPPSASKGAEIGIILQNSGPLMQKLFQLVGKRSDNPLVREASEQLFSNIRPFPFSEVTRVIEERTGIPIDSLFDHLEPE
ncbi:MAG: hypothetical protein ACKOA8_02400, partial [Deltaproteobacteria bacterium]